MDPLTQGLLGAAAAQATVGRRLGWRAALVGLLGGMAPDLDVLIRSADDPLVGLIYHRHFTHALAFIPVGGAAVGGVLLLVWPGLRRVWRAAIAAAVVGYATHGLLDACTSYGTLLLWPFSHKRYAWDVLPIIDPLFTLMLLVGIVWSLVRGGVGAARVALVLCVAYAGLGGVQRWRVMHTQEAIAHSRGHAVVRGRALPTLGNIVVWRSLYEADGYLWADAVRVGLPGTVGVREGSNRLTVDGDRPALGDGPRARGYRVFRWFADEYTGVLRGYPGIVIDGRYSSRAEGFAPLWGLALYGMGVGESVTMVGFGAVDGRLLSRLWWDVTNREGMFVPLGEFVSRKERS